MEVAAAPKMPAGRSVLVPALGIGEVGNPIVSALRAGGAALRAAPKAPRAATEGVAAPIPSTGQGLSLIHI
eukprot:1927068-Alexandrium_andersonii.AAC.1